MYGFFCLSIALGVMRRTRGVCEAKISSKGFEFCAGELWTIVGHDHVRDAMDRENAFKCIGKKSPNPYAKKFDRLLVNSELN